MDLHINHQWGRHLLTLLVVIGLLCTIGGITTATTTKASASAQVTRKVDPNVKVRAAVKDSVTWNAAHQQKALLPQTNDQIVSPWLGIGLCLIGTGLVGRQLRRVREHD
ncbi:hypothetical protein [Levilactobacillus yonginensis]|uniref:hypothetical protein n=1 Tax=Levilactobacillus yonginensis TaxID=1054041 RepID=UPI000F7A42F4|nr:hypothetical protein [Levilactobacillus yonginensis]